MSDRSTLGESLPPAQEAIRARCFHPTGTFVEFAKDEVEQSIPSRFEKIVARYPDRIAVQTRNCALGYHALSEAADRVARAILTRRGEKNEAIALLLERDAPMIAAILGILKAGKIYVPLDPTHPPSRLAEFLQDSEAGVIITDNRNSALATELASQTTSLLNLDAPDNDSTTEKISLTISPDSLAYIRYTSGSTGEPKAVMEKHRNLLHAIMQETNAFHFCADDRLSFPGSWGKHIFRGLLTGAALYPTNVKEEGLVYLGRWLVREQITILHSTPTLFRHIAETMTQEETFPDLRLLRLAGEAASSSDVELYKKHCSSRCVLVNELGSTEAGGIAAYFIDKEIEVVSGAVPVGYPLEDVKVLLLNQAGREVDFDETGEIAVKSRYLFPGYWRKPEHTRRAFLTDSNGENERIFLTGDLAIRRPDGCLFHLGRKDFRVKVRGLQVDVEHVEAVLRGYAGVQESVVEVRTEPSLESRLVAYIVPRADQSLATSELRAFLEPQLPDHMIPSVFVFLDSLPLTATGKLDRRALPHPGESRPNLDLAYATPRNPLEEAVATIWAEVLSMDRVGIHDGFFELGGHSLAAMRVVSRVIKKFQVEVPLQALFAAPTVAEMATAITKHQAKTLAEQDMNRILAEIEQLTDEEARKLLATTKDNG